MTEPDPVRASLSFIIIAIPAVSFPAEDAPSPPAPGVRPAAIRTEGVPEIAPEVYRSLHRYQEIRGASFVDWHPVRGMLVASRIDNLQRLYHVGEPESPPSRLTGGDEPVTEGRYLPVGRLIFSRGAGGDENFQIYLREAPDAPDRLLTDGKSRNVAGPPDRAGNRLPFTSTRRNGSDSDLYVLDLSSGAGPDMLLEVKDETWRLEDWSQDGTRAILLRYISANDARGFLIDIGSRARRPLPPEEGSSAPGGRVSREALRFGPGSTSVYLASDARGEFRELARLDLATGKTLWLTGDIPWDVEDIEISPDSRLAAFTVNADGYSRLHLLDLAAVEAAAAAGREPGAGAARREVPLGSCVITDLRFSRDSARLGFTLARASSPAEAYGYEVSTGAITRWTSSERSGFTDADFIEPDVIRYEAFDGRKVPAFVYRPRQAGARALQEDRPGAAGSPEAAGVSPARAPVIVNIHGGPESQVRPVFSPLHQYYLRELGAAVITPNVRGSTGYGKTYALLDNGTLREDSVRDIGGLLDWIERDGRLDPSRVAVTGGSYGGYMVLASLVLHGSRLRAGVDVVGVSNFATMLRNTSAYRRELRRAEYGDERDPAMREFFERISPANHIRELRSALLVIHGANDPRVPLSEAEQIVERARLGGKTVWTLYASNEGHGFRRRENTDYQEAVTVEFLRRHALGSGPSSGPAGRDGPARHAKAIDLFHRKEFRAAVEEFDESIRAGGRTHAPDGCWERGLALYYAGEFRKAAEQFEAYHRVGPLDIENGLWRYLSIAAVDGVEKARTSLPAYPERRRLPFPALLDLYAGKGSIDAVLAEAAAGGAKGDDLRENLFYAHLYIAKHLQAIGEREKARAHVREALARPVDHFMYACARIEGGK